MILMIVSLILVSCVFVMMCLLIMAKRSDQEMESFFIDRLDDLQGVYTLRSLPPHTRSELQTGVFPCTQQELAVNAMSSYF
jgi:hypothetical protein